MTRRVREPVRFEAMSEPVTWSSRSTFRVPETAASPPNSVVPRREVPRELSEPEIKTLTSLGTGGSAPPYCEEVFPSEIREEVTANLTKPELRARSPCPDVI